MIDKYIEWLSYDKRSVITLESLRPLNRKVERIGECQICHYQAKKESILMPII